MGALKIQTTQFTLPVGGANRKSLVHDTVLEIRTFVESTGLRSARAYKETVSRAHSFGLLKNFPVEAAKVFGMDWKDILFDGEKYVAYEEAVRICLLLNTLSKSEYVKIPKKVRAEHRIPYDMVYYKAFPGWINFKAQVKPSLTALRGYCYANEIKTVSEYREFALSEKGKAFFVPERAPAVYASEWRGWDKILCPKDNVVTIESRNALMKARSQSRASSALKRALK
jgi:hypothetical protein